jgi:hypothetical protein
MQPEPERRMFSHDEATALLPVLRPLLLEMRELFHELVELQQRFAALTPRMRGNGSIAEATSLAAAMERAANRLRERFDAVTELGVEIKDIETGLVDFPSPRDGRVVYLCWLVDEASIDYWHELDAGFRGRRPL